MLITVAMTARESITLHVLRKLLVSVIAILLVRVRTYNLISRIILSPRAAVFVLH